MVCGYGRGYGWDDDRLAGVWFRVRVLWSWVKGRLGLVLLVGLVALADWVVG